MKLIIEKRNGKLVLTLKDHNSIMSKPITADQIAKIKEDMEKIYNKI